MQQQQKQAILECHDYLAHNCRTTNGTCPNGSHMQYESLLRGKAQNLVCEQETCTVAQCDKPEEAIGGYKQACVLIDLYSRLTKVVL